MVAKQIETRLPDETNNNRGNQEQNGNDTHEAVDFISEKEKERYEQK
jgi:hypothetical protein